MLEWILIGILSLKVTVLTVFQGLYSYAQAGLEGYSPSEWYHLIAMNGVPVLGLWLILRSLKHRRIVLLTFSVLINVLCLASTAKVRLLAQPVIFPDIAELRNVLGVRDTVWTELPATDYLILLDSLLVVVFWKRIGVPAASPFTMLWARLPDRRGLVRKMAGPLTGALMLLAVVHGYRQQSEYVHGRSMATLQPYLPGIIHYRSMGVFNYFVSSMGESLMDAVRQVDRAPSADKVEEALRTLTRQDVLPDLTMGGRRPNVIIILMESLGRMCLDAPLLRDKGIDVVPFFASLQDETIFTKSVFSPVVGGATVEAEFMVLNSLLPQTEEGFSYNRFMSRPYRSLTEILKENGYHTAVFHGYVRDFWHRQNAYEKLGFDRYDSWEHFRFSRKVGMGMSDSEFLLQAAQKLRGLPEPYFAFIITLSGHRPYVIPGDLQSGVTKDVADLPPLVRDYLETMNYADRSLAAFWSSAADVRGNAVVAVLGDHGPSFGPEGEKALGYTDADVSRLHRYQVPLVISVPRGEGDGMRDVVADESDVAPTILHLLGIEKPRHFIGTSLLGNAVTGLMQVDGSVLQAHRGSLAYDVLREECRREGHAVQRDACRDLIREAEAARVVSEDVVLGKRHAYASPTDSD